MLASCEFESQEKKVNTLDHAIIFLTTTSFLQVKLGISANVMQPVQSKEAKEVESSGVGQLYFDEPNFKF